MRSELSLPRDPRRVVGWVAALLIGLSLFVLVILLLIRAS